eukprot:m.250318 g.250318  ORF g.250318 m.250318 type:complete len:204 (+) comp40317_c1_seq2:131-742(+)
MMKSESGLPPHEDEPTEPAKGEKSSITSKKKSYASIPSSASAALPELHEDSSELKFADVPMIEGDSSGNSMSQSAFVEATKCKSAQGVRIVFHALLHPEWLTDRGLIKVCIRFGLSRLGSNVVFLAVEKIANSKALKMSGSFTLPPDLSFQAIQYKYVVLTKKGGNGRKNSSICWTLNFTVEESLIECFICQVKLKAAKTDSL